MLEQTIRIGTQKKVSIDQDPININDLFRDNPGLNNLFKNDTEYNVNPENGRLVSHGHEYFNTKRLRSYIKIANVIRDSLPTIPEGHVRLWRGNRPGELGKNPSFTNCLEGIALPFLKTYGGKLSFIDIPEEMTDETLATGLVAEGSEFILSSKLASQAEELKETTLGISPKAIVLCLRYANKGQKFDKESFTAWLVKETE